MQARRGRFEAAEKGLTELVGVGQLSFFSNISVQANTTSTTTIVLTLDDGTVESFVATGPDDFHGFVSTSPIDQLTIATSDADADGDFVWA